MRLTERLTPFEDSIFTELAKLRAQLLATGVPVVDLSIGSPDLPPSTAQRRILSEAVLEPDLYRYAVRDQEDMLQAVADHYRNRFSVEMDPHTQICSMLGSQEGLAHIAMALLDAGDTVLTPDPGYPIFSIGPALCGMDVRPVPQRREDGFLLQPWDLPRDLREQAKLLIFSYPANPTTAVADKAYFQRMVGFARENDLLLLHDNAYNELTFDGYRADSFLMAEGAAQVGIEFFSLSKTYNLAGARIAFAVGNPEIIRRLKMLKSHLDFGMFLPLQRVAAAALRGPQDGVETLRMTYQRRRDLLLDGLEAIGWSIPRPKATMFVWAPLPSGFSDARAFADTLARRSGVIVVPGTAFGPGGQGFVRLALVQEEEILRRAIQQIRASGVLPHAG